MVPELIVFFTAMAPFLELKLAIPVGMSFGLSTTTIFLFAVPGAILPGAIMLALIGPISRFLRKRSQYMDRFFEKLFNKTRKEHTKRFNRYEAILIIILIAIPLPGSGTSVAALIAFVFGVDYWKSITLMLIGTIIGAILVTAGFGSIFKILDLFT
ncbi:MAG: small multi-drug export protein [Nitrospirota bacterium]